jgi:DNA-binding MurR/RpiR family transcriptional regulator
MGERQVTARQFVLGLRGIADSELHTEKERQIAAFLVERGQLVVDMGIADISNGVQVSNAMVVKFCKNQGLSGFNELRQIFEQAYENWMEPVHPELELEDSPATILQKICSNSLQDLEDSMAIFDYVAFEQAVEVIRRARKTSFYAVGGSGPLALDAHHKFMLIGLNSQAYTDGHLQAMDASLLTKDDVVVGISYGGNTKDLNYAMGLAQKQGATTISITNNRHSRITKVSDIRLYTAARGTPLMGENSSARFIQMIIISALAVSVVASDHEVLIDTMQKTRNAVRHYRIGEWR